MPQKESSAELSALAGQFMNHPDQDVRRLAASVLSQDETGPASVHRVTPPIMVTMSDKGEVPLSEALLSPVFAAGFWHGLWRSRRR